ncbi:hypothetical protein PVNG_02443 [Plasmodium vivax North Korean]|uniref:DAC domain-containing protein n=1 Tax=Plasmodium vivax North Korean TaxID=1035514 RepID=A0A0J9TKP2_PLAVI|nr:hypothetical protein PVNG_02443 [Plasmodium vivax North Korean]
MSDGRDEKLVITLKIRKKLYEDLSTQLETLKVKSATDVQNISTVEDLIVFYLDHLTLEGEKMKKLEKKMQDIFNTLKEKGIDMLDLFNLMGDRSKDEEEETQKKPEPSREKKKNISVSEFENFTYLLSEVLLKFSRRKVGSLIVIEKYQNLQKFITLGYEVKSKFFPEFLFNIFLNKESSMHDGGVIIRGLEIRSISSYFPISSDKNIPNEYGSRHRAALGITSRTDALAFLVSETSGKIMLAKEGKIEEASRDNLSLLVKKNNSEKISSKTLTRLSRFYEMKNYAGIKDLVRSTSIQELVKSLEKLANYDLINITLLALDATQMGDFFLSFSNEHRIGILSSIKPPLLSKILEQLHADQVSEILSVVDKKLSRKIIFLSSPELRKELETIGSFSYSQVGSIMNTSIITLPDKYKVSQALSYIKKKRGKIEIGEDLFVVN